MLQIYSIVQQNTMKNINSHAYITKTYHQGKPLPIGTFVLKRNFSHVHFSDKLKPLRNGPYKILDRPSDVTYEHLSQDGSTLHVHRNQLIPYYPKEPLLYPHLRKFMQFADSCQFNIPKPLKYANSDSSPFNCDTSLSDEDSSPKPIKPPITSNHNFTSPSSNDNLPIKPNDNSSFKSIIKTNQSDFPIDRPRHLSQNQSPLPPPIDRITKTYYKLRRQPKIDYRIFIPPSKL